MADVLEILREVDEHFRRANRMEGPGSFRKKANGDFVFAEPSDLWRRVRRVIKELENDRSRLRSGAAHGDGSFNDCPAPAPAISSPATPLSGEGE